MKRILLIFLSVLFISSCNDMYTPEKPDNTLSGVYEGVYNSVTEEAIYYELNLDTNTLSELSSNEKPSIVSTIVFTEKNCVRCSDNFRESVLWQDYEKVYGVASIISLKLYIEFDQKERRVISFEPEVVVQKDVGRFAANCTLKEHERRI